MNYASLLAPDTYPILLFHGVVPRHEHEIRNYNRKHISTDRFIAVLRELSAKGTSIAMPDVVAMARGDMALPYRAFAVTFDDGFANAVAIAAPILAELRIPATFYITTAFVERGGGSWTDLLEQAVEACSSFRLSVPLPVEGRFSTRDEKIRLLEELRRIVKRDPAVDPYELANELWRQLGVSDLEPDPMLDIKMSWTQVRALAATNGFTVGGHGDTHRILTFLSPTELEREIATSISLLRDYVGGPIEHYSYPEGLAHCYSDDVIAALRRHGIHCAPTAEPGVNRARDDLFRLKRIQVTEDHETAR